VQAECKNIALRKRALQRTDFNALLVPASSAVDGDVNAEFNAHSCSCTETYGVNPDPWWAVDLDQVSRVTRVVVFNRQDCCGEWMQPEFLKMIVKYLVWIPYS
jgi:hypothetical protein